jgi:transcription initiation factor TFIIE subunit alpha
VHKTYYYINYRQTIDAIKWKMYTVGKDVQGVVVQTDEKKEYFCLFCKAEWTAMEVLDNSSDQGFLCHRCGHVLKFDRERNPAGHAQSTLLNEQFKFITEVLPQLDQTEIQESNFEELFEQRLPVVRDETHQRTDTEAIAVDSRPMAVKGSSTTGPQTINISIQSADGPSEAEREAEKARKAEMAKRNEMPSWHLESTIGPGAGKPASKGLDAIKKEEGEAHKPVDASQAGGAQIDDIFAKLKAEQALEQSRKIADDGEDSGSDDEDEDGFEDVPTTGASSARDTATTPIMKREASGELSGASEERQAKRVKIESEVKTEPAIKTEAPASDEDDDELEFEDV